MFNFIIGFLSGGAIISFITILVMRLKKSPEVNKSLLEAANFNPKVEIKKENLAKLENFIAQKQSGDRITNDEAQDLLKVSDATAERYLQEMEKLGKIKQVGVIGQSVYYLKV